MKSRIKTFWTIFSFAIGTIVLITIAIYISASSYYRQEFHKLLKLRAYTIASNVVENTDTAHLYNLVENPLYHEKDYFFKFEDIEDLHYKSDSIGISFQFLQDIYFKKEALLEHNDTTYKGILYPSRNTDEHYIVIASAENYHYTQFFKHVFYKILVIIAFSLIISLIYSYFISFKIYKPIQHITARVKEITSENLHLRLDEKSVNDDINELACTFNQMLNRLETSFEIQNNFISNASHELRTPLTAIIGEADVALNKTRSVEEYIETIKIILVEAEKLDEKTKALLFLAQTGFNGKIQENKVVRIDEIMFETIEMIKKTDKRYQIQVDLSLIPENPKLLRVYANVQLLQLALFNILTNGCKYSDFKTVTCFIGSTNQFVSIIIKDIGIGIPEEELKFIYDPFFRASNTKKYDGYGVGLPLTRNIIKMHSGEIKVNSVENEGTSVHITLPIVDF